MQVFQPVTGGLTSHATFYLTQGVTQGDSVLIVATPESREQFALGMTEQGIDVLACVLDRRIVFCDAQDMLVRS